MTVKQPITPVLIKALSGLDAQERRAFCELLAKGEWLNELRSKAIQEAGATKAAQNGTIRRNSTQRARVSG